LPLREGSRNSMKAFLSEIADLEDSQEGQYDDEEARSEVEGRLAAENYFS